MIERATLELIYWVALGLGLGLLVLSLLLGNLFEFADIELGGTELSVFPVLATAVAAFGAGGLLGTQAFGLGEGGSIITGVVTGVAGGGFAVLVFSLLRGQEAKDAFELAQLIGRRGRLSLAAGPGRVGRVTVTYEGMTRSFGAASGEDIAAGEEVVIKDVIGSQLTVARPAAE